VYLWGWKIAKDPGSEVYDIISNGLLASQTSETTCIDPECLQTHFLRLYADLMLDLNPLAELLGDSKEAIATRCVDIGLYMRLLG